MGFNEIDLRPGTTDYRITTTVTRGGTNYMGPDIIVTARNEQHAREIAKQANHIVNEHFPPVRIRK